MEPIKVYTLAPEALERVTFVDAYGDGYLYLNVDGKPCVGYLSPESVVPGIIEEVKPPAPSVEDVYRALGGWQGQVKDTYADPRLWRVADNMVRDDPQRARKIVDAMEES